MAAESDPPLPDEAQPTRGLLLAQALEMCILAERKVPGSADQIIAHQPAWARAELRRLLALAGSLDATATNAVMSEEFRETARARLMRRIGAPQASPPSGASVTSLPPRNADVPQPGRRRRSKWLWRTVLGGFLASILVLAATLTASASALPGEPLYGFKQVREELGVRFALDDQARALLLMGQADARLDETRQLLQQGRTERVAETTQRFDEVLNRATTTYVVTASDVAAPEPSGEQAMESKLMEQQQQLQRLLATAPEPAAANLREALVVAQRNRALVADRHPPEPEFEQLADPAPSPLPEVEVERAADAPVSKPAAAAAQPTTAPVESKAAPDGPVITSSPVQTAPAFAPAEHRQLTAVSVAAHTDPGPQMDKQAKPDDADPPTLIANQVAPSSPPVAHVEVSRPVAPSQKQSDTRGRAADQPSPTTVVVRSVTSQPVADVKPSVVTSLPTAIARATVIASAQNRSAAVEAQADHRAGAAGTTVSTAISGSTSKSPSAVAPAIASTSGSGKTASSGTGGAGTATNVSTVARPSSPTSSQSKAISINQGH